MAGESKNDVGKSVTPAEAETKKPKKSKGVLSRIWGGIFRLHGDDFEKRLQHISKEEAAVLARMKRRSQSSRRMARHLIILSVLFEIVAVGYAILTTRSMDLNWKMRALRVMPMFLLPALSSFMYSALRSFTRMCDRKDQKTLERLRAERQAKIDELKEKTNYYTTQQLIQRYDPDPAAKAAAATVLASKLGADSGLQVFVGDETKLGAPAGKSIDVEVAHTSGLRNRKASHAKSSSEGSASASHSQEDMITHEGLQGSDISQQQQLVVEHYQSSHSSNNDGGWFARIAALLVGEDPSQSYALICGNCHMHNGLARKEDFPYITYYCPHCNALNGPKQSDDHISGNSAPNMSSITESNSEVIKSADGPVNEKICASNSPAAPEEVTSEGETTVPGD